MGFICSALIGVIMDNDVSSVFDSVGGYFVPTDPMDGLVCESCE